MKKKYVYSFGTMVGINIDLDECKGMSEDEIEDMAQERAMEHFQDIAAYGDFDLSLEEVVDVEDA